MPEKGPMIKRPTNDVNMRSNLLNVSLVKMFSKRVVLTISGLGGNVACFFNLLFLCKKSNIVVNARIVKSNLSSMKILEHLLNNFEDNHLMNTWINWTITNDTIII